MKDGQSWMCVVCVWGWLGLGKVGKDELDLVVEVSVGGVLRQGYLDVGSYG